MQNNSTSIAQHHPAIYREVLGSCQWVGSAPGVSMYAGEHSVLSGGLSICQQVPLRVYVGLEYLHPGDFTLEPSNKPEDHREFVYPTKEHPEGTFRPVSWSSRGELSGTGEAQPISSGALSDRFQAAIGAAASELGLTGAYRFRSLHELRPRSTNVSAPAVSLGG